MMNGTLQALMGSHGRDRSLWQAFCIYAHCLHERIVGRIVAHYSYCRRSSFFYTFGTGWSCYFDKAYPG